MRLQIGAALRVNAMFTTLSVSGNQISYARATELFAALKVNSVDGTGPVGGGSAQRLSVS